MRGHSQARAAADRAVAPGAGSATGQSDALELAADMACIRARAGVGTGFEARAARQVAGSDCLDVDIRAEAPVDYSTDASHGEVLAGLVNWAEALNAADRAGSVRMTAGLRAPESNRPKCTTGEFALSTSSSIPGTDTCRCPPAPAGSSVALHLRIRVYVLLHL
jgi:hypothetical protein